MSVCCTTYNHENYIEKAIEGFLMQKTTFPIEIIIHDDASTDNTANIIKSYAEHDDRIVVILQEKNQYSQKIKPWPNFVFPRARGKYIALCEGDDYWTDPFKLQKQVDFLDANQDYGICFHDVEILNDNTGILRADDMKPDVNETTILNDLLACNYIFTPTAVLRNDFKIPKWYYTSLVGDWPLYFLQIKGRKLKKIKEKMAVYRENDTGVWSLISKERQLKVSIEVNRTLIDNLDLTDNQKDILNNNITDLEKTLFKYKRRELPLVKRIFSVFNKS